MAIAVDVKSRSAQGTTQKVIGRFTFSGTYPTGGESVPIYTLAQVASAPLFSAIIGSSQDNKYVYNSSTQKVMVRTGAAPPVEIAAAAYPAGVTADVVDFEFTFNKF